MENQSETYVLPIGDIASYWDAECIYQRVSLPEHPQGKAQWTRQNGIVDAALLQGLAQQPPVIRDLKLYLKGLISLSDDQLYDCFRLAFNREARDQPLFKINRQEEEKVEVIADYTQGSNNLRLTLTVWDSGRLSATGWHHYPAARYWSPRWNPGAVTHYLQRLGFFVPGTLDTHYVRLITS